MYENHHRIDQLFREALERPREERSTFLKERDDGAFEQRVAVKLIKPGTDTQDVLRRFEQERQILASLNHPGIARLYDGGSTENGYPYFVMELVEGEAIDTYCSNRGLPIEERLELFVTVCEA